MRRHFNPWNSFGIFDIQSCKVITVAAPHLFDQILFFRIHYLLSVPGFKGAKLLMPMSSDLSKLSVEDLQSRLRENGVKLHIDEVL